VALRPVAVQTPQKVGRKHRTKRSKKRPESGALRVTIPTLALQRTTLEKPNGRGDLRLAGGSVVGAHYSLVVLRLIDHDTGELGSRIDTRGTVEVIGKQGRIDLNGKQVTLALADSRCMEGKIGKGNLAIGLWDITAANSAGLSPC